MAMYSKFAEKLESLLKEHDRPASWLASQLGMSPSTVNRWLNEHTRPRSAEVVLQIAKILGINDPEEQIKFLKSAGYEYIDSGSIIDIGGDDEDAGQTNTQSITESGHADVLAASLQKRRTTITVFVSVVAFLLAATLYWNVGGFSALDGEANASPTTLAAASAGNSGSIKLPTSSISQTATLHPIATPLLPTSTPRATMTEPVPTPLLTDTPTWTVTPVATPTSASKNRCEAQIVSPRGIWPYTIDFTDIPDGRTSFPREFQQGDKIIIQRQSADGRWYEIAELNDGVLGWADPKFFTDCIQTSQ